jgi:hypothetical protein
MNLDTPIPSVKKLLPIHCFVTLDKTTGSNWSNLTKQKETGKLNPGIEKKMGIGALTFSWDMC